MAACWLVSSEVADGMVFSSPRLRRMLSHQAQQRGRDRWPISALCAALPTAWWKRRCRLSSGVRGHRRVSFRSSPQRPVRGACRSARWRVRQPIWRLAFEHAAELEQVFAQVGATPSSHRQGSRENVDEAVGDIGAAALPALQHALEASFWIACAATAATRQLGRQSRSVVAVALLQRASRMRFSSDAATASEMRGTVC